ncbi:hypothetical protein K1719_038792 [Acacia pycnantha]|nr:hypothetical protein K1719_038792 [Acacia pycnantha]
MSLEVLEGRDSEQFAKIYAYCGAIMKFNPESSFRGHLLSAVGKDANNNMYPIAYAIVESECKDSWNWFMTLLFEDNGSCKDKGWVVMSYMQKHAFSTSAKCDIVQNNIAETLNSFILVARDKPIITMCEIIRRMLMKRIVAKREGGIEKSQNVICPKIIDKLQRAKNDSKNYICYTKGDGRFELQSLWKKQVVDLMTMTCIPCGHAVAAIYQIKGVPENYVSAYYSKDSLIRAYAL